jgi:hypothetical protein
VSQQIHRYGHSHNQQQQQQQQQQSLSCSSIHQVRTGQRRASSSSSSAGLVEFAAAAGRCLPYLTQLDLSGMCVHSLAGSSSNDDSSSTRSSSLLAAIGAGCPRLAALHLPGWLWQGLGETLAASADLAWGSSTGGGGLGASPPGSPRNEHTAAATAAPATPPAAAAADAWAAPLLLQPYDLRRASGLQQALSCERLSSLAGLAHLRLLRLAGPAVPLEVLRQLGTLTQLQVLVLNAACDMPLAAASQQQRQQQQQQPDSTAAAASNSSSNTSSGTVLGSALAQLQRLCQLTLSGIINAACASLGQLSSLASLTQLDIKECAELSVQALSQLSGLTGLRVLKVRRVPQLRAKARAALPLELQQLRQLVALALDCDLHLRDIQVRRSGGACLCPALSEGCGGSSSSLPCRVGLGRRCSSKPIVYLLLLASWCCRFCLACRSSRCWVLPACTAASTRATASACLM